MAFPIPEHLPRVPKSKERDISSSVLNKVAEAKTLDANTASAWVAELDGAVVSTKRKIYDRIHENLLSFNRQLEMSTSVQKRLITLRANVHELSTEFNDPEQGILPKVFHTMKMHSTLIQQERHANILNLCLQHLAQCKDDYAHVEALLDQRRIPEAVATVDSLMQLIRTCPSPLDVSNVVTDLKSRARALKDNAQEQLAQAYSQSISITKNRFSIHSQYSEHLSLASILSSMPEDALSTNLAVLRKDILAHILDPLISESVSASIEPPSTLVLTPIQPPQPVPSIRTLFHFISTQLLPHLPTAHQISFASSLYVPLTTSLTTHLLTPAIPNSLSRLPPFLTLVQDVVQVEREVSEMGFMAGKERRIFEWSQGARGHYERKRRAELIEKARFLLLQPSRGSVKIEVDAEIQGAEAVDLTEQTVEEKPKPEPELELEVDTTAWAFDDGEEKNAETKVEQNEDGNKDGWGFEDDGGVDAEPTSSTDVDDDDPWSQGWNDPNEVKPPSPPPPKQPVAPASQKGQPSVPIHPQKAKSLRKESYLVSQVATALVSIAEDVVHEGSESLDSSVFEDHGLPSTSSALVLSTAPAIFDLFRALYPVSRAAELEQNITAAVEYSNDCVYLAERARKIALCINIRSVEDAETLRGQLKDVAEKLECIGESWLQEVIDRETRVLKALLAKADRFVGMSVDVRFHHAQDTMKKILERVHHTSAALRPPMTTNAYYTALGGIINAVLARVLKEVLGLRDIPEVESQRLAALCRILHPLDELFVESADEVSSVAVYVPSWLKFTYLSDILEGTLAEISAWFDAGHLVDYDVHELNSLLVALFSATPVRAEAIAKFSRGHPRSGY